MLRKSLSWKLTLAFVLVAFTDRRAGGSVYPPDQRGPAAQLIIDQQRSSLEQSLSDYYTENGSWAGVAQNWQQIQSRCSQPRLQPDLLTQAARPGTTRQAGTDRGNFLGLADARGMVIVSVDPNYPAGVRTAGR